MLVLDLLDESVRILIGWVKSIPKNMLANSIALENFLLSGNKEDGFDKIKHWNIFGGVVIYKSSKDSLYIIANIIWYILFLVSKV